MLQRSLTEAFAVVLFLDNVMYKEEDRVGATRTLTPQHTINVKGGSGVERQELWTGTLQDTSRNPIGGMLVCRRQLGLSSGGVCSVLFSSTRAASTSTQSSTDNSPTTSTPEPTKTNGYNPPPLPVSPLMDPNKYIKLSRRSTKPQRPRGNEPLSPQAEALRINPYARILATDVRNEVELHRRLPSWFLIRFVMLRHPETNEIYLVPDRIREDSERRQTLGQARWVVANKGIFGPLGRRKAWQKLVGSHDFDPKNVVWGNNMAEHVLKLLRERVRVELEKVVWREVVEVPWDGDGFVGCVLDWTIGEKEKEGEFLISVKGKATPLHHMRTLLGDEMAMELQAKMRIPEEMARTGLLIHERSLKAQMWLMRIRAYLCIW